MTTTLFAVEGSVMVGTDLSNVLKPIGEARGLPNAHYTCETVFEAEKGPLWLSGWAGLCVEAAVPEPGDACPYDFLGLPLLVLRGRDGVVRVFQNICRHRGMILVPEKRRIEGAIRCPYHSWCYTHDGRLVATPHVGGPGHNIHPDIRKEELGLIEVRSHVWMGVIFVNVSGDAPPFETSNAGLIARWSEFDVPFHHDPDADIIEIDCRTNWKLAVENYCESYHLPWVHPALNSYSRLEDHYNIIEPDRYSGQGTHVYRQLEGSDGSRLPDFPDLSPRWATAGEYLCVWPNVLLGVQRDHAFAIILEPRGPRRTREHIHLFYAASDIPPALRRKNAQLWKTVFLEDIGVVEGMQSGRGASGFDGGRFSPVMDAPTHEFHRWVARRMIAAG